MRKGGSVQDNWLNTQLKARGETQAAVAGIVGMAQPNFSALAAGRLGLSIDVAVKLARHFDMELEDVVYGMRPDLAPKTKGMG
jgi:plasmid maintenance system antidote protein VapI